MTAVDDLTAFINARLDDDERYARVFLALGQRLKDNPSPAMTAIGKTGMDAFLDAPEAVAEAVRWKCRAPNDLERVLREVAAKRAIVAAYAEVAYMDTVDPEPEYACGRAGGLGKAVRHLAAVWSDHPGYKQEWAL
jgi:hypothetical protein